MLRRVHFLDCQFLGQFPIQALHHFRLRHIPLNPDIQILAFALSAHRQRKPENHLDMGVKTLGIPKRKPGAHQHPRKRALQIKVRNVLQFPCFAETNAQGARLL